MALPTPLYGHLGPRGPFRDVYEPAEDTFLLLDALERDAGRLREAGCTDINPMAAYCTQETALLNNVHLQPVITDLVKGLSPRLNGKVDLLLFNPPYVVTPSEEEFLGIAVNKLLRNSAGERKLDNWLHPRELKHPYDIVPMEREDTCAPRRCLAPLWTERSPGDLEQAEADDKARGVKNLQGKMKQPLLLYSMGKQLPTPPFSASAIPNLDLA
ncbi:hypothetical protein TURU_090857 [Turdus rufiventris]|nr:hypothetical protein TURU_090857 [Turdus rufiventris]